MSQSQRGTRLIIPTLTQSAGALSMKTLNVILNLTLALSAAAFIFLLLRGDVIVEADLPSACTPDGSGKVTCWTVERN